VIIPGENDIYTWLNCEQRSYRDFEIDGTCFNKLGYEIGLCTILRRENKCPRGFR
jgi:hypothetical protein